MTQFCFLRVDVFTGLFIFLKKYLAGLWVLESLVIFVADNKNRMYCIM